MSKNKTLALLAGLIIALVSGNVVACGESLFRVGKGVAFREYTAPLPGSILVVANTEAEFAMVERLAAAGHDIHVVSDPSEIAEEIKNHDIDVVLAYFSQRDVVESQMSQVAATYIPVAEDGTLEFEKAGQLYPHALTKQDSVLTFLKKIHKTLKTKT